MQNIRTTPSPTRANPRGRRAGQKNPGAPWVEAPGFQSSMKQRNCHAAAEHPRAIRRHRSKHPSAGSTTINNAMAGRFSGSRIILLTTPSPRRVARAVHATHSTANGLCGVRPRLQRRVRGGFAPPSLSVRPRGGHRRSHAMQLSTSLGNPRAQAIFYLFADPTSREDRKGDITNYDAETRDDPVWFSDNSWSSNNEWIASSSGFQPGEP